MRRCIMSVVDVVDVVWSELDEPKILTRGYRDKQLLSHRTSNVFSYQH
jgi:hypothetical protein